MRAAAAHFQRLYCEMSAEQKKQPEGAAAGSENSAEEKPRLARRLMALLQRSWIVAFIFTLVMIHAMLFAAWKLRSAAPLPPNEVTLGEFGFIGETLPGNPISRADFRLHVSLLEGARFHGHELLAEKQHKVQQEVEQLLRQSHGADFEDPLLGELKRRIQAVINRTLGEHVIGEIIITDLQLDRSPLPSAAETAKPAEAKPWREASSS
jgi:hypothetical protein